MTIKQFVYTLILMMISNQLISQDYIVYSDVLTRALALELNSNLGVTESEYLTEYKFDGLKNREYVYGDLMITYFKIKKKDRPIYRDNTFNQKIDDLIFLLEGEGLELVEINMDTTLLTFKQFCGAEQLNYVEIYLPLEAQNRIEMVYMAEYKEPNRTKNNLDRNKIPFKYVDTCQERCLISDQLISRTRTYYVYSGDANSSDPVKTIRSKGNPTFHKWVKKNPLRNPSSSENKLVWCLEEVRQDDMRFDVVLDTVNCKKFYKKDVETLIFLSKGGYVEFKDVLCYDDLNEEAIYKIKQALNSHGFNLDLGNNLVDEEFMEALNKFQQKNGLPIGHLDFETLSNL